MKISIRHILLLMAPFLLLVCYFGYPDWNTYRMAPQYSEIQSRPELQQQEGVVADHVKRNAPTDQLELFLRHSSIISRITSGIALQTDLMKRSIPIDDVIGELLNFGDAKMSELTGFEMESVKNAADMLIRLPDDIDSSAEDLEDEVVLWNKLILESESANDALNPPKKEDYFTALEKFSKEFDYTFISSVNIDLQSIIYYLVGISGLKYDENTPLDDLKSSFNGYFFGLMSIFKSLPYILEKLKSLSNTIGNYKVLKSSEEVFKPIQNVIQLRKDRYNLTLKFESQKFTVIEKNFRNVFKLANVSSRCLTQVDFLTKLAHSRTDLKKVHPRKYTSVFFDGISEMKSLSSDDEEQWIETVSKGNITKDIISKGLKPLLHFTKLLGGIDDTLESAYHNNPKSLDTMKKLLEETSKMKQESIDSFSVVEELKKCNARDSATFDSFESEVIINSVEKLGDLVTGISETIKNLDIEKLKKDIQSFKDLLGFTNIKDDDLSASQVPQALKNLKENDSLSKFKTIIDGIKTGISFDKTQLEQDITTIQNGKDKMNSFLGFAQELQVHTCLQALKNKSELLAHVIRLTQSLKKLNSCNTNSFKTVVSDIVEVSKNLVAFKSLPSIMIKKTTSFTNETAHLPRNISDIIGAAVSSLRSAHQLKTLATTSIPELKKVDDTIKSELKAVSDPTKKKSIEDSWGNHDQDMATLDEAIKQIDKVEVDMNLTRIKYINEYGKPFLQLTQLKNVNIDTKSKIQALDMLISTGTSSTKLEKSKATLSTIDSLDLQFSNHQTQFRQASMAFQNFYKFFVDITTLQRKKQAKPSSVIYAADPNAKQETDYVMIGGVAGGSFFLGGAFAALFFVSFKYWRHQIDKNALKKWVKKQMFTREEELKYCDAYRVHEAFMIAMEIQVGQADKAASRRYLPESKQRGDKYCNPDTALDHLKKDGKKMPIHANLITTPEGKKFIATQAPMKQSKIKDDTREDFWHMVMHEGVENIVMLCTVKELEEGELYFAVDVGTTVQFGRYIVKTLRNGRWDLFKSVNLRQFEVTDEIGFYRRRRVTQFQYIEWKEGKFPRCGSCDEVCFILREVSSIKVPTVVHCLAGIGRTMTFIGVQFAAEAVKLNQNVTMVEVLTQLREARWYAVQTIRQSYWLQVAVCVKLNKDYKLGMDAQIEEILETFQQVAEKHRGPPEFIAKREKMKQLKAAGAPKETFSPRKTDKDFGVFIEY